MTHTNYSDSVVLHNLLLLQKALWLFPSRKKIIEASCHEFKLIPGISNVIYHTEYFVFLQKKDEQRTSNSLTIPLNTMRNSFGYFEIIYEDLDTINHYLPFIENIILFISILIENKEQLNVLEERKNYLRDQRLESLGTFAGAIAHDFNNILSIILGFSEVSLFEVGNNCSLEENLNEIILATKKAKDLIKQILIFSRDQKLEKSSINLNSTVKNAIKLVKGFIPKTISIEIDIKGDENIFFGNSIHFHQIILNLITNAQQAMTTGHGIIKVSLTNIKINEISPKTYSTFTKKNYYCLIVSDTGEGMPEHIVDHIFDPFFTTKNEGTGLGLSTIYGIVKNYNGYIDVESHLHEGTTFKLYFPIEKPIKNDKAKSIESNKFIKSKKPHYTIPSKLAHFSSNFVNKSLIMIDDEKSNTLFMRKVCSQYKIDAQFYDNSMECYKKVFENVIKKPDLIITDFNMPLMNGIEFATLVKKKHPSIPIIMISGSEYNIPKIDELDGLFHKLLFKPVDQETLITCIADIFN